MNRRQFLLFSAAALSAVPGRGGHCSGADAAAVAGSTAGGGGPGARLGYPPAVR